MAHARESKPSLGWRDALAFPHPLRGRRSRRPGLHLSVRPSRLVRGPRGSRSSRARRSSSRCVSADAGAVYGEGFEDQKVDWASDLYAQYCFFRAVGLLHLVRWGTHHRCLPVSAGRRAFRPCNSQRNRLRRGHLHASGRDSRCPQLPSPACGVLDGGHLRRGHQSPAGVRRPGPVHSAAAGTCPIDGFLTMSPAAASASRLAAAEDRRRLSAPLKKIAAGRTALLPGATAAHRAATSRSEDCFWTADALGGGREPRGLSAPPASAFRSRRRAPARAAPGP